jgi:hypothetical protein
MPQKVNYLYNNTYNQGCCRVCRRVCKKPCRVKVTTDSSGSITDFRVNGQKIRKIEETFSILSISYNGRTLKKNESVLLYFTVGEVTVVILINDNSSYWTYVKDPRIPLEEGRNNLKKEKCVLSKKSVVINDNQSVLGTLIRNNKIINKNGNVRITKSS